MFKTLFEIYTVSLLLIFLQEIPFYKMMLEIHLPQLVLEHTVKLLRGLWNLPLSIFLSLLTVKFPTYNFCLRNMHKSRCYFSYLHQI